MRPRPALIVAAIVLAAVSLRPSVTAVGPVLAEIRLDTGISAAMAGCLTTLPILAYAAAATFSPLASRRLGINAILFASMIGIAAGVLLRWPESVAFLFLGTLVVGISIGFANVMLPAFVKGAAPARIGTTTSLYTTVMVIFAAVGAGLSVPISLALDSWRLGLLVWAPPALLAAAVWFPLRRSTSEPGRERRSVLPSARPPSPLRSRLAWAVTTFFGLQAAGFYITITWLPAILVERGTDPAAAGWLLALLQIIGVVATLAVPIASQLMTSQRALAVATSLVMGVGWLGLLLGDIGSDLLWLTLIGIGQGGSIGLGLMLFALRARNAQGAASLSGMAQSFGYLIAAAGPVLTGLAHDVSGGWEPVLAILLLASVVQAASGYWAGASRFVN